MMMGVGCADRATAPYPISPPPVRSDFGLGKGDTFDVRVFGETNLTGSYQVAADGRINFPLIGEVMAEGKSPAELEKEIRARLSDGFLRDPQVSIITRETRSKKVSVFGQVKTPGTFPYNDDMSIIEAVTRAGGFTELAKKNSVRVTRGVHENIVVAVEDIGQGKAPNFYLRPGDVVFVPERLF